MGCTASKHPESAIVAMPGKQKVGAKAKKGDAATKIIPADANAKPTEEVDETTDGDADGDGDGDGEAESRTRVLSMENVDVKEYQATEAELDGEVNTRRKMTVMGTHPTIEGDDDENRPRTESMLNAPTEDLAPEAEKATRLVQGDGGIGNGAHGIASVARSLPVVFSAVSRPGNDPQKRRKENQDTYCLIDQYGQQEDAICACVFDGHGPNGALASAFVKSQLPKVWLDKGIIEAKQVDEIKQVLFDGCVQVNKALAENNGVDAYVSGTTGILSYLRANQFFVANVGDSRAVLARKVNGRIVALDLSDDHKPDRPDEHSRILNSGGRVFEWGVPRVWKRDVDMPGLAMSRSFGDLAAESVGVFAEPEITCTDLCKDDLFIVLATDGIWEFMSSQLVVDLVASHMTEGDSPEVCHKAAVEAVKESTRKWGENEDVVDDTTIVIMAVNYKDTIQIDVQL